MKVDNKKILNITTKSILLIVPFFKFFSMCLEKFGLLYNYDSINPAIILYVSVPILGYIYIKDLVDSKRKLDIFDYIFYALVITGIISVIFSINKELAIFGKEFRHEGFLSLLSYYLIFINYKINGTKEDIKKFLKLITVIGVINVVYSLLQIYTNFDFIIRFKNDEHMASGLCGNPNFLGSLMVICLSILIYDFFVNKEGKIKKVILISLFFVTLINAQSTGPMLAFIVNLILVIILLIVRKEKILMNTIILLVTLLITYTGIYIINTKILNTKRCEFCANELKATINSGGTGRLKIWKNSIDIVKKHPITGVGFDNFELAYPNPKPEGISFTLTEMLSDDYLKPAKTIIIIDNAHNVYLHTLVTSGILGLIPYLGLCLLTFIKGMKSKDKLLFVLFGGFVGYSIQAFVNISVIQVAPIYYLLIGLILSIKE